MSDPRVLALDVGTSGVKGVLADSSGTRVDSDYRSYSLDTKGDGWVDQDLYEIWNATVDVIACLAHRAREQGTHIECISVTAQMFNALPVDRLGEPLMPMMSWLDQRADMTAADLQERVAADEQFELLGSVISAKDIAPKILWIIDQTPEVASKTWKILDCKEAMVLKLTGRAVTDIAGASAYRLLDTQTLQWSAQACHRIGVPISWLPDIEAATSIAGGLLESVADLVGIPAGTPVMVGAGDVPASQVGSGAVGAGDVHLSLGTAIYFGISLSEPRMDPRRQLGVLGHMDPQQWILWLEIATGGAALAWVLRSLSINGLGAPDFDQVDRSVQACAESMDSLIFAPWLSGERVPLFDDHARAAFVGLGLNHGPGHLLRAVMEGVAFQMRWALEYGEAFGQPARHIRAVGGGTMGRAWLQIMANILNRPLEVVNHSQDAGAVGAAACALVGLGHQSDFGFVRDLSVVDRVVVPQQETFADYERRYHRYRALYEALRPHLRGKLCAVGDGMTRMPRGVVFDLDGVIVMSEHLWEQGWTAYAEVHGASWYFEDVRACQGKSVGEWADYLAERTQTSQAEARSSVVEHVIGAYQRGEVDFVEGSPAMLADISATVPIGLATSAPREIIDAVMGPMGLGKYFTTTVSSADVPRGKPWPDVYLAAISQLGIDPKGSLAVEDSSNGVRSAAAAGLTVIAIEHEPYPLAKDAREMAESVHQSIEQVHRRLRLLLEHSDDLRFDPEDSHDVHP